VTEPELLALRGELDRIADAAGFPAGSSVGRQDFDRGAAAFLGRAGLPAGEMLRAETWTWIAVYLVPHLVQWRFGGSDARTTLERYAGSLQRNTIGRLWFRAWVFDGGEANGERWALVNGLPEDATVAILERTRIASDHRLARELARRWLPLRADRTLKSEDVLREAAKGIRVLAVVRELNALDDQALGDAVDAILADTVDRLRAAGQIMNSVEGKRPEEWGT
jgi:hypothetical protein